MHAVLQEKNFVVYSLVIFLSFIHLFVPQCLPNGVCYTKGDFLQAGLPHERQERHPHEAHKDDKKSIKHLS